jgi:cell division protein FtsN
MSAGNPGTLTRSVRRGDRSRALLKGAAVVLCLSSLCFMAGFYVIAPLLANASSSASESQQPQPTAQNATSSQSSGSPSVPTDTAGRAETPPPANTPPPAATNNGGNTDDGPLLAPPDDNNDFQRPGSLDRRSQDETARNRNTREQPARTDTEPPANLNDNNAETNANAGSDAETRSESRRLFRVQVGVYSTQQGAEQEVRRLSELGFQTSVVPMRRDDKTLYRVQHGIYRIRANAEAARQKLVDSGVDAIIIPQ